MKNNQRDWAKLHASQLSRLGIGLSSKQAEAKSKSKSAFLWDGLAQAESESAFLNPQCDIIIKN